MSTPTAPPDPKEQPTPPGPGSTFWTPPRPQTSSTPCARPDLPPSPPPPPAAPILRRATGPTPPSTNRPAHRATEQEEAIATTSDTATRPLNAATANVSDTPVTTGGPRLRLNVLGEPTLHLRTGHTPTPVRIRPSDCVQIRVHLAVQPDGDTR